MSNLPEHLLQDLAELEKQIVAIESLMDRLAKSVTLYRGAIRKQETALRRREPALRQKLWQRNKLAKGLCITCGRRPVSPGSKNRCDVCLKKIRTSREIPTLLKRNPDALSESKKPL